MSGPVDFGYLETFAAGDRGVVRDVLGLFLAQARDWEARLAAPDSGWPDLVHTIKGTARGVGAYPLGDLAETAEREGPTAAATVRTGLQSAVAAIEAYLAR